MASKKNKSLFDLSPMSDRIPVWSDRTACVDRQGVETMTIYEQFEADVAAIQAAIHDTMDAALKCEVLVAKAQEQNTAILEALHQVEATYARRA